MLESHNDTAVMLAEHLAGSVEQFADEMNQKARELGLSHTHLSHPMVWTGQMTAGAIGPRQKNWQGLCAIV